MDKQGETSKRAWEFRAYEFWVMQNGIPDVLAEDMKQRPEYYVRRHLKYMGDVKDKKIANLLGSFGKKAVPLALLGADVTVVDISEQNRKYATELAEAAGVNITYIVSDIMEFDITEMKNSFDITYLEGGILHYFTDIEAFTARLYALLKPGGRLVLNDFHPFRKMFNNRSVFETGEEGLALTGDYFDCTLQYGEFPHKRFFPKEEQGDFPECLLRYWTMGEIVTAIAQAGFVIEQLVEGPRFDEHKNIPGEFTLVAEKNKM